MPRKQGGFTLVEIAIVLVIIGLLLGGVLKGQELIQSAKIKNVISDFTGTTVGIYGYQDRYKALPGDDAGVETRWSGVTGIKKGDGDGKLAGVFTATETTEESFNFWAHLRQAGFTNGSGGGGPKNAFGGTLGVQEGGDGLRTSSTAGTGFTGVVICESNVPDKVAAAIDSQLDDGNPATGVVRAIKESGATPAIVKASTADANYVETGTTTYTVCKSL